MITIYLINYEVASYGRNGIIRNRFRAGAARTIPVPDLTVRFAADTAQVCTPYGLSIDGTDRTRSSA
jgi:hypothetical protein